MYSNELPERLTNRGLVINHQAALRKALSPRQSSCPCSKRYHAAVRSAAKGIQTGAEEPSIVVAFDDHNDTSKTKLEACSSLASYL